MSSGVSRALSWPVVNLKNIVDDKKHLFPLYILFTTERVRNKPTRSSVAGKKNAAFQSINVNTVLLISDDNVPLLCRLVLAERDGKRRSFC